MRSRKLHFALLMASFACAGTTGKAAAAQSRVQATPKPPPPGIQKPNVDPTHQAIANLKLQIEALRQSAGRQIVVLHYEPVDTSSWADADNNFSKNTQRAEAWCKEALGDRYSRVLSREAKPNLTTNRWYFPNLLCETKA